MIDILLSTFNGEKFLDDLFTSLLKQTFQNFRILVRDDGSTDDTMAILKKYSKLFGERLNIYKDGSNKGFLKSFNFLSTISTSDYIMFCDQDDVWLENKIEHTFFLMKQCEEYYGKNSPLLVFTDLKIVDGNLNLLYSSYFRYRNISPKLALKTNRLLTQNVITGCTVMINKKLKELAFPLPDDILFHDWWMGLVASLFGHTGFLNKATVLYRQHQSNTSGNIKKFNLNFIMNRLKQGKEKIIKDFTLTQKQATALLERFYDKLSKREIKMLKTYSNLSNYSFFKKRVEILKHGFFKSGILRNIYLLLFV